jgi:outer membrane protein assembly factor BamB
LIYLGSSGAGALNAVDTSGQEVWRFQTKGEVTSSPALADGMVYFRSWDTYVYAVDAQTGQEEWSIQTGDEVHSSPVVSDGVIYIGSNDGYLYALQ